MSGRAKAAIFIICQLITALLVTGMAKADIGPAQVYAEGGTLKPSAGTDISMDYEKVVLTYGQPQKMQDQTEADVIPAHVVAQFKMNNPSKDDQKMKIYFPADDSQYVGGWGDDKGKDITNFAVNGAKIGSGVVNVKIDKNTFGYNNYDSLTIKAYQWDQTFKPGETTITVEYDTMSAKNFGVYNLTYVLGTGRGWSGPIKQGEVDFVFPDKVQSYAVVDHAPRLKDNKLSYIIDDKTIKVAFTNYEPADGDAIALGISDPAAVSEIEKAKQVKPQTLDSTIRIAGLFRSLSGGGHCYLCVEPSAEVAKNYYSQAFSMASSKDELNKAMASLAFGNTPSEYQTWDKMFNWFSYFTEHRTCDTNDEMCNEDMYVFSNVMPFAPSQLNSGLPSNADLLALYACRLRPYDFDKSVMVENYAGQRIESCPTKEPQADQNAMTTPGQTAGDTAKKQDASMSWPLLLGVVAGSWLVLGAIIGLVAAVIKWHHHRKVVKTSKQPKAKDAKQDSKESKEADK